MIQDYIYENDGKEMNRVSVFHPGLQVPQMCDIDKIVYYNVYLIIHVTAVEANNRSVSIIDIAKSSATPYVIAIGYFENSGTYTLELLRVKLSPVFSTIIIVTRFFIVSMLYFKKRLKCHYLVKLRKSTCCLQLAPTLVLRFFCYVKRKFLLRWIVRQESSLTFLVVP